MTQGEAIVVTALSLVALFIALLAILGVLEVSRRLERKYAKKYDGLCTCEVEHGETCDPATTEALAMHKTALRALWDRYEVLEDKIDGRLAVHENPLHSDKS